MAAQQSEVFLNRANQILKDKVRTQVDGQELMQAILAESNFVEFLRGAAGQELIFKIMTTEGPKAHAGLKIPPTNGNKGQMESNRLNASDTIRGEEDKNISFLRILYKTLETAADSLRNGYVVILSLQTDASV